MSGIFFQAFGSTFIAILEVAVLVIVAAILVRVGIVKSEHVKALSDITVFVFLPAMIFSKITTTLRPDEDPLWWTLPLSAIGVTTIGFILAWLAYRKELPEKINMLPMVAIQNAGMLVLSIGQILYTERFDAFAIYIFLYILAHNPTIWSVGKFLISRSDENRHEPFRFRSLITPPIVANLCALFLVFTGLRMFIPEPVAGAAETLGSATVPSAMFILGASLGSIRLRFGHYAKDAIKVIGIKLFAMPAIVIALISLTPLREANPMLAVILVLEGAAAPAVSLIIAIKTYGGDIEKTTNILLFCYVLNVVTLPLWVAVWTAMG